MGLTCKRPLRQAHGGTAVPLAYYRPFGRDGYRESRRAATFACASPIQGNPSHPTAIASASARAFVFAGGRKKSANAMAAASATVQGTRNKLWKSVVPSWVKTVSYSQGQTKFATSGPR